MLGIIKMRAGLLGVLALMLLGAFSAAPALAEGGPYCHHRPLGGEGEGELIKEATPEQIFGEGGLQKLEGGGVTVESEKAQVKGVIYNNPDQCQVKIEIQYQNPKTASPHCHVVVGTNNIVKIYGHQVWKWNGEPKQLEPAEQKNQVRDWLFLPKELQQGANGLPAASTFAIVTFTSEGGTCLLAGKDPVEGSVTAEAVPYQLGVWRTTEEQNVAGGAGKQHFWNGTAFKGFETGLTFLGAAKLEGKFSVKTIGRQQNAPQELAYFEK